MSRAPYQQAEFDKSAASLDGLPEDVGYEVAFAGRSNSGKSTAINVLCGQNSLARTSGTPGRTQLINVFYLDDDRRIMDLPGYGFAKAPRKVQEQWQELVDTYLQQRRCLKGLVLLMDIRRPLQEIDNVLLEWAEHCKLPVLVLLSKADKLKFGAAKNTLLQVQKNLPKNAQAVLFSGLKKQGVEQVLDILDQWLDITD
jgi:GTP-binding protein